MKYVLFAVLFFSAFRCLAQNYSSADMDAIYMATLKAVVDYKMNDEENSDKIQKLREDKQFNEKLQKKLNKLNNNKMKNGSNKRVYELLLQSGKKIYNELN